MTDSVMPASQKIRPPSELGVCVSKPIETKDSLDYAIRTHDYIKQLNHLTDQRANYMIVASSILLASSINLGVRPHGDPFHSLGYWLVIGTVLPIIAAVLLSVRVILPKTFDATSPFHTSAIAAMTLNDYLSRGQEVSSREALEYILRENHTVSQIIEFKSQLVRYAAAALYLGISLGVSTWISATFFHVQI